ncbi:MAG: methyltransferase domain-containing protein [Patescibacteria group bacterium]|nr:methyltransferase domain-containing protein [Patescibacteria group bacterium]
MERNLWHDPRVAAWFKDQHFARPYVEMMRVFSAMLPTHPKGDWLDIGCGAGEVTKLLWERSNGAVSITGFDVNAGNQEIFLSNTRLMIPTPSSQAIVFGVGDICHPMGLDPDYYDGIISGLCLSYAEYYNGTQWTDEAYLRVFSEIHRALKPGGRFVFSSNVPDPDFTRIMTDSWREILFGGMFFRLMRNGLAMVRFSRWLKECATIKRFHYPPIEKIQEILANTGFKDVRYELTYAKQAWVVGCNK